MGRKKKIPGPVRVATVRLPVAVVDKLEELATYTGRQASDELRRILEAELDAYVKTGKERYVFRNHLNIGVSYFLPLLRPTIEALVRGTPLNRATLDQLLSEAGAT